MRYKDEDGRRGEEEKRSEGEEREREDGEELMSHAKRNAMQREVVPRVLHRHAPHGGGRHRWRFAYSGIVQELIYLDPVDYYYLYTPYIDCVVGYEVLLVFGIYGQTSRRSG